MMEGEATYVAGLLAAGLAFGVGAYVFDDSLYALALLVLLAAVLVEAVRVAILGKERRRLRQLWLDLKHALWSA